MEYYDIYDINRNKTGKIIKRGERMLDGEFHLFVQVWIINKKGYFLSQQRSENMSYPLVWCANGGNARINENAYDCARREIKEELGIELNDYEGKMFDSRIYTEDNQNYFCDSFLYYIDLKEEDYIIQKEEIKKVEYKSIQEIRRMIKDKAYFIYDEDYLDYLENESININKI